MNQTNYFDVLGVPQNATEEQIERAFRDRIKAHPPRKDPEMFRLINEAGKLRDPQYRRDYLDSLKEESIREFLVQYEIHMANREYNMAAEAMKMALEKQPNLPMLQNLLGHCYAAEGSYREAVICYQKAYNLNNAAVYLYNIAYTYFRDGNYAKAEGFIEKCLYLEPNNKKGVIMYSRILNGLGKQKVAVAELEKVLRVEEGPASDHLDVLIQLLITHLDADQKLQVKIVLKKIKALQWEDAEERLYAADRIWDLCQMLAERDYFEATYQLLQFCQEVFEEQPQIEEMLGFYSIARFLDVLVDDAAILNPVKQLFSIQFCKLDKVKKAQLEKEVKREFDLYILKEPNVLQKSLERLQKVYPKLYESQQEYIDQVLLNLKRNRSIIQKILRGWF